MRQVSHHLLCTISKTLELHISLTTVDYDYVYFEHLSMTITLTEPNVLRLLTIFTIKGFYKPKI